MAKLFNEISERLLRAGVAPRHVRRYLAELTDHLADLRAESERAGLKGEDAESAALVRLGGIDELSNAMIAQRQFQSWSVRAPWAIFGFVPLFLLAASYLVALSILWSGWHIFLPESNTPFVPVNGLAVLYFGIGRSIYYGAPILIGWGMGLVAARQRLHAVWPIVGSILIAFIGGTAQVHAGRVAVPSGVGHISMGFTFGSSVQGISYGVSHALLLLAITVLPYLVWRLNLTIKKDSLSARLG